MASPILSVAKYRKPPLKKLLRSNFPKRILFKNTAIGRLEKRLRFLSLDLGWEEKYSDPLRQEKKYFGE
jgi:hypothetical protein